jgi:hypothetical protein
VNRRLVGLLAALCLTSACSEDAPVGRMEPIPQLRGKVSPPPEPPRSTAQAPAPVDPSKVVLRWKLAAPLAFTVATTSGAAAPLPPAEDAPPERGKKPRKGRAPPPRAAAAPAPPAEQTYTFVLNQGETGEPFFHIFPQAGGEEAQGQMTERGFVLDGVSGPLRDLAVLVLELPLEPVGPGGRWSVATTLVDSSSLRGFVQKESARRNDVRLTALTPGEAGEQVATLEYELMQRLSGSLRDTDAMPVRANAEQSEEEEHGPARPRGKKTAGKAGKPPRDTHAKSTLIAGPRAPMSAEVRVKGRGEFLVKAGHWRSFEATLTTRAEGTPMQALTQGERTVRLTPVEPVPEELLKRLATKK